MKFAWLDSDLQCKLSLKIATWDMHRINNLSAFDIAMEKVLK
jgi:hypothetical protein